MTAHMYGTGPFDHYGKSVPIRHDEQPNNFRWTEPMTRYFVYRDPSGEWSVSQLIDADNWKHLVTRPTWEQAKNHAFALARIDHDYRPLPARMVVVR